MWPSVILLRLGPCAKQCQLCRRPSCTRGPPGTDAERGTGCWFSTSPACLAFACEVVTCGIRGDPDHSGISEPTDARAPGASPCA